MRRLLTTSFLILSLAMALGTMAQGQEMEKEKGKAKKHPTKGEMSAKGSTQDQLAQMEKDRAAAVVRGDTAYLDKYTSDDYVLVRSDGKSYTKAQMIDDFKSGASKVDSFEVEDLKVSVYGNTAVVTAHTKTKGKLAGKDMNGEARTLRVYVKKNGRWQSVAYQQTKIE